MASCRLAPGVWVAQRGCGRRVNALVLERGKTKVAMGGKKPNPPVMVSVTCCREPEHKDDRQEPV